MRAAAVAHRAYEVLYGWIQLLRTLVWDTAVAHGGAEGDGGAQGHRLED